MTKVIRMFKKIDHINIVVRDLYAAKKFFLELGFTVLHEGSLTGIWIDSITNLKNVKAEYCALGLKDRETAIELIKYDVPENSTAIRETVPNEPGFRHVAFEVENIEAVVAQLRKSGVKLFSDIQKYEPANKKLCYFYGPEGIILELAEYNRSSSRA